MPTIGPPMILTDVLSTAFSHVYIDIVGPSLPSHGFPYLLTVLDRSTRWPEASPLTGFTSECARTFTLGWVECSGVHTSNHGCQFTSTLWKHLVQTLGTHVHWTTAYHPQSNGFVKNFYHSFKATL